jgi:hypothetical protein
LVPDLSSSNYCVSPCFEYKEHFQLLHFSPSKLPWKGNFENSIFKTKSHLTMRREPGRGSKKRFYGIPWKLPRDSNECRMDLGRSWPHHERLRQQLAIPFNCFLNILPACCIFTFFSTPGEISWHPLTGAIA